MIPKPMRLIHDGLKLLGQGAHIKYQHMPRPLTSAEYEQMMREFNEASDEGQIYRFHNRSNADLVYIGCKLYGFASAHDGIYDYAKNGSTFGDKIAGASRFAPGGKLKIDDYAMSFDGEFVGTHRVVLMRDGYHVEACASLKMRQNESTSARAIAFG